MHVGRIVSSQLMDLLPKREFDKCVQLYKCRWQRELFFKWIKQYRRIKIFFGTTQNAVKTQIWVAIRVYVLVAIIKKELDLEPGLGEILQILLSEILTKTASQNNSSFITKYLYLTYIGIKMVVKIKNFLDKKIYYR